MELEDNQISPLYAPELQALCKKVLTAARKVMKEEPYTGGCRTFYSPAEWKERGEEYGLESELILCHDGGDFASLLNSSYGCYDQMERFSKAMEKYGYYVEQCTSWYSAVYKI